MGDDDEVDAAAMTVLEAALGVIELVAPVQAAGVRSALARIRARLEELHQREQARLN